MLEILKTLFLKTLLLIPFLWSIDGYPLNIQLDINNMLFRDNYIFFVEENDIRILNPKTREFLPSLSKPLNSSISLTKDSFLICEWENFRIENIDEYSTKIWLYILGEKEEIEILEFHQTVKSINCSKQVLLLETSIPQLEKKYFEYDFKKKEVLEIDKVKDRKIVNSWRNKSGNILVKRNISNIVWIYRKVLKF